MSGHNLTLGAGGQAPTWVGDPTRGLLMGSGGFLLLKFANNGDLPWNVVGANNFKAFSIFGYCKLTGAPSNTAWMYNFTGSGRDSRVQFNASAQILLTCGLFGGNAVQAHSTTVLASGSEYSVGVTCGANAGDKARVYINGVKEGEVSLTHNAIAFGSQPFFNVGADGGGFTGSPAFPGIIGRTLVYDGELSEAQVAGCHLSFRTIYAGLPAL